MKYVLDTNACIEILRRGSKSLVWQKLNSVPATDVGLPVAALFELLYGAQGSHNPPKKLADARKFASAFALLQFDARVAEHAAEIRVYLESLGTPIGPYDLLIAATAKAHGLIVVTHNTAEFSRVPGLACEDWQIP